MWIGMQLNQSTSGMWNESGLKVDFYRKSDYHGPSLALEEEDDGETCSEGRSSQGSNLSPIPIEADKLLYPWKQTLALI